MVPFLHGAILYIGPNLRVQVGGDAAVAERLVAQRAEVGRPDRAVPHRTGTAGQAAEGGQAYGARRMRKKRQHDIERCISGNIHACLKKCLRIDRAAPMEPSPHRAGSSDEMPGFRERSSQKTVCLFLKKEGGPAVQRARLAGVPHRVGAIGVKFAP